MKRAIPYLMLFGLTVLAGCHRPVEGQPSPVKALDLKSGEVRTFSSQSEVPAGWSVCTDDTCRSIPTDVACQDLGEAVCTLNATCRLKVLWCEGSSGSSPGSAGGGAPGQSGGSEGGGSEDPGGSGSGSGQPPSEEIEEKCAYSCLPKEPLLCDELQDAAGCKARADCEWGPGVCPAMTCSSDAPCPPCPEMCQPKAPPVCADLDQQQCSQRPDCSWAGVCPECAFADGTPCECKETCMPSQPTDPVEPPPAEPVCDGLEQLSCSQRPDCEWIGVCPACAHEDGTPCPCTEYCASKSGGTDPGQPPQPGPTPTDPVCKVTGCSGTICAAGDVATTCEWAEWYACYKLATCQLQADGQCGWTKSPEFDQCMTDKQGI